MSLRNVMLLTAAIVIVAALSVIASGGSRQSGSTYTPSELKLLVLAKLSHKYGGYPFTCHMRSVDNNIQKIESNSEEFHAITTMLHLSTTTLASSSSLKEMRTADYFIKQISVNQWKQLSMSTLGLST